MIAQHFSMTYRKNNLIHNQYSCAHTWHLQLKSLSSILRRNYEIIKQHSTLSKIFPTVPTVAFRRKKNLSNFLIKNDIATKNQLPKTEPCKSCKFCPLVKETSRITNDKTKFTTKIHSGGTCKTKNIIMPPNANTTNSFTWDIPVIRYTLFFLQIFM